METLSHLAAKNKKKHTQEIAVSKWIFVVAKAIMPEKKRKVVKTKTKKDVDWTSTGVFDKNRVMVYIEHTSECPIFGIKAEEFITYLQNEYPDRLFQLIRNQNGKVHPRPGAFEIKISQNAKTSIHDLWSGIDKGPPRREKFPQNYSDLLPTVNTVLKKFYAEQVNIDEDMDEMAQDEVSTN